MIRRMRMDRSFPFGDPASAPCLEITRYDVAVASGWVLLIFSMCALGVGFAEWFATRLLETRGNVDTPTGLELRTPEERDDTLSISVGVELPSESSSSADSSVRNDRDEVTRLTSLTSLIETMDQGQLVLLPADIGDRTRTDHSLLPLEALGKGNRPLGLGGSNEDPRSRGDRRESRWVIHHAAADSLRGYACQPESIGIQVAAVNEKSGNAVFLNGITGQKPVLQEVSDLSGDRRMSLSWSEGSESLTQADRELFLQAGFDTSDLMIIHFLSPEAEEKLATLEAEAAAGRDVRAIRRTEFGIRPKAEGFEFFVIRVLFR